MLPGHGRRPTLCITHETKQPLAHDLDIRSRMLSSGHDWLSDCVQECDLCRLESGTENHALVFQESDSLAMLDAFMPALCADLEKKSREKGAWRSLKQPRQAPPFSRH